MRIASTPDRVYAALMDGPVSDRIANALLRLRGMKPRGTIRGFFAHHRFILLEEKPPRHVVFGLLGKPWHPSGGLVPCEDRRSWLSMIDGEHAAIVIGFNVRPEEGSVVLETETRIHIHDRSSRRKFSLYWFLVRPPSTLLRKRFLHAVKYHAEKQSGVVKPREERVV
ncbi:MAG: hypothetical protein OEV30_05490 [Ignavibacteria bacterium]|nr:hypothetical protein [Ignavibacteria bacterium]